MTIDHFDFAIIGGGIVGLSSAMHIAQGGLGSVVVLETEDRIAAHQTGNNSGVIHSGLYYKPGSLKAENCLRGRELLYAFCQEHAIAHERCGKLVVAVDESEIPSLDKLEQRGRANGLDLRRLGPDEIRNYEPHVTAAAALWVPETGIVDFAQVAQVYHDLFLQAGGEVRTGGRLLAVHREASGLRLVTTGSHGAGGEVTAGKLINCGGVYSDRVARMCGVDPKIKILPFRGEHYELVPDKRALVKNLIYPVPDPQFPFLGVHFTRRIGGEIEAGPNAVLAFSRTGYKLTDINLRDLGETLTYPGFWQLAGRHWRMGFGELYRSLNKREYLRSMRRMIPELGLEDIVRGGAGVRAQALGRDGKLLDDFYIETTETMIHVLNAPSPAATASLSIGAYIAELAGGL